MSERDIVRVRRLPDGTVVQFMPDGSNQPIESRIDWARVEAMTEEEIEANALADPDNPRSPRKNWRGCAASPIRAVSGSGSV